MLKISKIVVKLTRLYGLVIMTLSKKHKKINCYHLKNDKDSVENRITERRRTVVMTKVQQLT